MAEEAKPREKWARISGEERVQFRQRLAKLYVEEEMSVRRIVEHTGTCYGLVHKILKEAGVQMRPRGNPMRT